MTSDTQEAGAGRLFGASPDAAWRPGPEVRERSRLLRAMEQWGIQDLEQLHARSIADPEWFWRAAAEDLRVDFEKPFSRVIDTSDGFEFPRWFVGGELNAAWLCSHRHAKGPIRQQPAVVYEGDTGQHRSVSFEELDREVRRFAANLSGMGVVRGDRVVLFLPVVPEAVIAFLACAMIGAIVVPAFTGFGPEALSMRLIDAGAKVLVTADSTTRRGKPVPMKSTADEALQGVDSIEQVVVVRHLNDGVAMKPGRDVFWDELPTDPTPVETAAMESNDPLTIIYTSGTTGAPKGILHSHAGFSLKAAIDFAYGFDIREGDVIAWIADMGWMLGPLLIMGGLQLGATIVLTEGVPTYPTPSRLWEIAERNRVTFQGIAPTAARAVMAGGEPIKQDLSSVRSFASTGEAWDEPTWNWLFHEVGGSVRPIVNYSGGTETGGGILVSYPFMDSDAAGFNGPLPGMDVVVLDERGEPVHGVVGELCVRNTWPGMTNAFWHDRKRYLKTYWDRWPNTWVHGDLASVDRYGAWRVHGRSDDTLKVSGRRVGPAEIEAGLLRDRRIVEAAAIGVPDPDRGQRVVAFVVLRDDPESRAAEFDELYATAVHNVGKSFAPKLEIVKSLPKTKNGKIMRRAIRAQHLGLEAGDMSSLDPATPLEDIPTLQTENEEI
ncbi:AMP-binding protein [Pseudarthrobacter sp. NPDC080039]|uniref:AMP-binding protein n=1 Tax=unclassified Pseudarthrobacter TaxID=2647000 RepID=UPI0034510A6F